MYELEGWKCLLCWVVEIRGVVQLKTLNSKSSHSIMTSRKLVMQCIEFKVPVRSRTYACDLIPIQCLPSTNLGEYLLHHIIPVVVNRNEGYKIATYLPSIEPDHGKCLMVLNVN